MLRGLQQGPGAEPATGMPWQIEPAADGSSRVFGLVLGHSTVADGAALIYKITRVH